jgi:hypothetical protein
MMIEKLSRRKAIVTLFGLTLFTTLAAGSGGAPTTILMIMNQYSTVIKLLEVADELSGLTLTSVDNAYQDLGAYLRENNFTTTVVTLMEKQHTELNSRFSQLKENLKEVESEASTLFELLKSRANENTTPNFKQTMLTNIREKENSFDSKIEDANQVLSQVGQSVQKYDDILGYAQVSTALDKVDSLNKDVSLILAKSNSLKTDIGGAIEEASKIIRSSVPDAPPSPDPSPSASTTVDKKYCIGIQFIYYPEFKFSTGHLSSVAVVASLITGYSAEEVGLKVGDIITFMNGEPIDDENKIVQVVSNSGEEPVRLDIARPSKYEFKDRNFFAYPPYSDLQFQVTPKLCSNQ